MKNTPLKTISLEEFIDKYIGKPGTPDREAFEKLFDEPSMKDGFDDKKCKK